ncbi:STAS domain-containing protein [Kitasatospora sp. KL5]|uniref:STAS domain-containing protein n=1 Tax=Kitasatospora sp. KL5 TaxID=3425125 RepID=UPI003D6E0659
MRARRPALVLAAGIAAVAGVVSWLTATASRQLRVKVALVLGGPFVLRTAAHDLLGTVRRLRRRWTPATRVTLRGEIDTRNADRNARLLTAAVRHTKGTLDIDMAKVTHLSHSGTTALVDALRGAHAVGIPVTVHGANSQVREALHGVGLDRLLTYRNGSASS